MKNTGKKIMGLTALCVACCMLATTAFAQAPAEEAQAPVEAEAQVQADVRDVDPIEGSWVLCAVYELTDTEPVLLKKEENQSLYGSGVGVYTFNEGGTALHTMIDGPDSVSEEASWGVAESNVYTFTENATSMIMRYHLEEDDLHTTFNDGDRTLDFVYARAFVGSWKLLKVMKTVEGEAPVDVEKEENQSLYAESENVLTLNADGTAVTEVVDGPDKTEIKGTWKLDAPDQITVTEDSLETQFSYYIEKDTIIREVQDAEGGLVFIYGRFVPEPAAPENKEAAAPAPQNAPAQAEKPAQPAQPAQPTPEAVEDELIADGQIFTGNEFYVYDPETGEQVLLKELNQGGYANDLTGVIYEQEGGGGDHFYGNDGSVLISEWLYLNGGTEEDELIADGQIFTGNEFYVYDPETGEQVLLKELNQGGYANEETGEIFTQEDGGGDHFYGDKGHTLVTEWYYFENIANEN